MTFPQKGNVRLLFDPIEELDLDRALEFGSAFQGQKRRLINTINDPPQLIVHLRPWNWLTGILVTGNFLEMLPERKKLPWGWRWWRHNDRDCLQAMPVWMWWIRNAWWSRYVPYRPFLRLGFLQGPEGGLYSEFRWRWRFWRATHIAQRRYRKDVPHWWERFAWWCERKEREYLRDVPRPWTHDLVPDGVTSGRARLAMLEQFNTTKRVLAEHMRLQLQPNMVLADVMIADAAKMLGELGLSIDIADPYAKSMLQEIADQQKLFLPKKGEA